jgi:hypothetical protein
VFGAVAVGAMLVFYSLESRSAHFVLAFAGIGPGAGHWSRRQRSAAACLASSCYAFLQGAWPFGVVEAVWCIVALRRWRDRVKAERRRMS